MVCWHWDEHWLLLRILLLWFLCRSSVAIYMVPLKTTKIDKMTLSIEPWTHSKQKSLTCLLPPSVAYCWVCCDLINEFVDDVVNKNLGFCAYDSIAWFSLAYKISFQPSTKMNQPLRDETHSDADVHQTLLLHLPSVVANSKHCSSPVRQECAGAQNPVDFKRIHTEHTTTNQLQGLVPSFIELQPNGTVLQPLCCINGFSSAAPSTLHHNCSRSNSQDLAATQQLLQLLLEEQQEEGRQHASNNLFDNKGSIGRKWVATAPLATGIRKLGTPR